MRTLVIVDSFPTVSETFILDQVVGLKKLGHSVTVLSLSRGEWTSYIDGTENQLRNQILNADMPQNVLNRFAGSIIPVVNVLREWPLLKMLAIVNPVRYGVTASTLRLLYAAGRITSEEREYDAIVAHYGNNGLLAIYLRQLGFLEGPVFTFFHGYDVSRYVLRHGRSVYRDLWKLGDIFFAVSDFQASQLVQLGFPRGKIIVHRMGVDPSQFQGGGKDPVPGEAIRLLSVGRLVEKKGFEYSIRAVGKFLGRNPGLNLSYEIIGDGILRQSLSLLVHELDLVDIVKLVGSKDRGYIAGKMRSSHIFIAPSVTAKDGDREGIPVSIMEAMATGLPIISTWHAGIPELVEDGRSGILVKEKDVADLIEAIGFLVNHPESRSVLGKDARSKIVRDHNQMELNSQLQSHLTGLAHDMQV